MAINFNEIRSVFAEVLQKPEADIELDKTIFIDLEVESVEALELEFSLEEAFGFSIKETDLWKLPAYIASKNLLENGQLNAEAIKLVKEHYRSISDDEINAISNPVDLHKYLRVSDVCYYINAVCKLNAI